MLPDYFSRWTINEIGTLDKVSFTVELPPPPSNVFTLSFWYCATQADRKQIIVSIAQVLEIYIEDDKLILQILSTRDTVTLLKIDPADIYKWHHVVAVFEDELQVYIDGNLLEIKKVIPLLNPLSNYELGIGGYTDPAGGHFDYTFGRNQSGWVDDVRWYTQALTAQHIPELQPAQSPIPKIEIEVQNLENGTIEFTVQSNIPDESCIFLWDFGDSNSGLGATVTYDYAFSGTYLLRLTVFTADYNQVTHEQHISVVGKAQPLHKTPVFVNGQEGYACYRIPSIVRAVNGDLIAFAEGRLASCSDSTDIIRIVCKRSHDNGKTWTPLQVIARNLIEEQEYAVQQNAPVVDVIHGTGRIILLYNKLEGSEFEVAESKGTSRIFCIISDDNGVSWHSEKDISAHVHRPSQWRVQRPTLGHAIQLRSGRLFFAGMMTDSDNSVFQSQNYAFWSDDLGETWTIGGIIPHIGLNEASAVELENGGVMINSRAYSDGKPIGLRAITIGHFVDDNTIEFDDTYFDETLIEPTIQASIIRYSYSHQSQLGSKSRLLFSNPNHRHARYNLTVRLSEDDGKTWTTHKTVEAGPSAYSDLVIQDDMRIGVLYEHGNHGGIYYTNFTFEWLSDGQDDEENNR